MNSAPTPRPPPAPRGRHGSLHRHALAHRLYLPCSTVAVKRARSCARTTVFAPRQPILRLQMGEKRRGWDSNPRDGSTPPTRFPIALLRPTRTPLLKTP